MAEPLKYMYNAAFFESLCPVMKHVIPGFDCKEFTYTVFDKSWPDLELKERVNHISKCLGYFLPRNFNAAADLLVALSQKMIDSGIHTQSFAPIFIPQYIQMNGLEHPEKSLASLAEITRLVSAEFAIRPFLQKYPQQTMTYMLKLSKHDHPAVRRFSSEGCRPRLPWGAGVPWLKKNPIQVLELLENLKADSSEYVRKSVANNLNDISKDHPETILRLAKKWRKSNSPTTAWIVRHACRTLLKRGDVHALALHGFDASHRSEIKNFSCGKRKVKIGDACIFNSSLSTSKKRLPCSGLNMRSNTKHLQADRREKFLS